MNDISGMAPDEDVRALAEALLEDYRRARSDVEAARARQDWGDRAGSIALHGAIWAAVYSAQIATLEGLLGLRTYVPVPDFIEEDLD